MGCDGVTYFCANILKYFYSHIPCGMWHITTPFCTWILSFLLTHPVWDVTSKLATWPMFKLFLLTHPVWDVTLSTCCNYYFTIISTHTSRVGCDPNSFVLNFLTCRFLLTHPVWDVTESKFKRHNKYCISTHTSRVGCDYYAFLDGITVLNFYSHIPCGMWPLYIVYFNHIIPIYYRMDL